MPMAAGLAHDSPAQERVIETVGYSSASTGIVSFEPIL
jgi:hypothetical protein